ncbi:ACP S-malonyltransferase [Chloroflexota bacterium]
MTETKKAAYVFPGQGAQSVGMGKDLYDNFDSVKAMFQQADEALEFPISKLCFEGPEDELRLTINTQPAVVLVSLACLQAINDKSDGKGLPAPAFMAGHSLGEYSALAATNALDSASTVKLARERGRLMHEAGTKKPGGMVAIIGLDEATLQEICDNTDTHIANLNCPGQIVISGAQENLPKAMELATAKGANRVVPLQVSGAFHTPLMQPAVDGMAKVLPTINFQNPDTPIIANVTAQQLTKANQIIPELLDQLSNSVQWQRSIENMIGEGVSTFVEIGPGKVLSGLIRRINKDVTTININDLETINNLN